jgi:2-methylcitrate dehydratase PrpD
MKKSGGKEILLSIVAGYDVFIRLGKAIYPSTVNRGFQSTAVLGAMASAAACARLLRLDGERSKNALAIAAPDSQPVQVGRSSEAGILSALFAERGVPGCDTIFEKGFLKAFADQADEKAILKGLGETFLIEETYLKVHGGCRGNHAPTDVILDLVKKHKFSPQEVKEVRMKVDSVTMAAEIHDPKDGKQAQFSIPFSIAIALLEGNASLYQFTDVKVNDPAVRGLMARTSVEVDKSLDRDYPNKRGAHGEILLTDGRRVSSSLDNAYGEPELPLNTRQIEEKFVLLTKDILGKRAERVCELVRNLETLDDIGKLVQCLVQEGRK